MRQSVKILREAGVRAVGLTDGDTGDSGVDGVLALPGGAAPESVVFADSNVRRTFAEVHNIDLGDVLAGVTDHHEYVRTIAARLLLDEPVVATVACDAFVTGQPAESFDAMCRFVQRELT